MPVQTHENSDLSASIEARLAAHEPFILRCRWFIPMAGEGVHPIGLSRPYIYENARVCVENGIITDIGISEHHHDFESSIVDCGDAVVTPKFVNAHTHLQLSWLEPYVKLGNGFTQWLKSFVPRLLAIRMANKAQIEEMQTALQNAMQQLSNSGTAFVGDVGGSIKGATSYIQRLSESAGLEILHFCEWFGFNPDGQIPWLAANRQYLEKKDDKINASPCGHALYSTSAGLLQNIKAWCNKQGRHFSFHLAESPEETELLLQGSGPLADYYRGKVLPENWLPPGKKPVSLAHALGLLDTNTLAVHCVQIDENDIKLLADSGCSICLCPRSNYNLAVGKAPVKELLAANINLCLGTDGLTSNSDLNIGNDAAWLIEKEDVSPWDVLRMLTINGARALTGRAENGSLMVNKKARFAFLDKNLFAVQA